MFLLGGRFDNHRVYLFDRNAQSWTLMPWMPRKRQGCQAEMVKFPDGSWKLVVVGGWAQDIFDLDTMVGFNIITILFQVSYNSNMFLALASRSIFAAWHLLRILRAFRGYFSRCRRSQRVSWWWPRWHFALWRQHRRVDLSRREVEREERSFCVFSRARLICTMSVMDFFPSHPERNEISYLPLAGTNQETNEYFV